MEIVSNPQDYYLNLLFHSNDAGIDPIVIIYLSNMYPKFNVCKFPVPLVGIFEQAESTSNVFEKMNHYRRLGDSGIIMASLFAKNGSRIGLGEDYYKDMSVLGYSNISANRALYGSICDHIDSVVEITRKVVGGSFLDPLNVK
jgi:hypothetical protein